MKKLLFISVLAIIVTATSCTKETTPESYYVRCKIDGVSFVPSAVAYYNSSSPAYPNSVLAQDIPNSQYINFSLANGSLAPTVQNYSLDSASQMRIELQTATTTYATKFFAGSGNLNYTEVTSTKVKGSFSGTLYSISNPAEYKVVTEGEFNVERN